MVGLETEGLEMASAVDLVAIIVVGIKVVIQASSGPRNHLIPALISSYTPVIL